MREKYIEINLSLDGSAVKCLELDGSMSVRDLKAQLALLSDMSRGAQLHPSQLVVSYLGKAVDDNVVLGSVQPEILLEITRKRPSLFTPLEKDTLDLTLLTQKFREITRDDIPSAKQRHLIQEHQRKASAAVADALTRSQVGSMILSPVHETIHEEGVDLPHDTTGPLHLLRLSFDGLLNLVEARLPTSHDIASRAVSEFADGIASCASFEHIHDDLMDPESLESLLSTRPLDRTRITKCIIGLCRLHSDSCSKSQLEPSSELAFALERGDEISKIAEAIVTLVASISGSFHSPSSHGLLPVPTEQAALSPELVRWAQGLTPKHRAKSLF
jgi:hypothetical protein